MSAFEALSFIAGQAEKSIIDMQEDLGQVSKILSKLEDFTNIQNHKFKAPRISLLLLLMRAQEQLGIENLKPAKLSKEKLEDCKRIGQFALKMYATSNIETRPWIMKNLGLPRKEDVLFSWFWDDPGQGYHCPKFVLFVDELSKSVVLSIRGTKSIHDAIADLACDEIPFLDGFAHQGMLLGATRILRECGQIIMESLTKRPGYRLVITGHSLGAGTAILLTMSILSGKECVNVPAGTNVECTALAPPPVYRSKAELPAVFKENILVFIYGNDCVPSLSLANLATFLAQLQSIDALGFSRKERLKIIAGYESDSVTRSIQRIADVLKQSKQDHFQMLEHVGEIYYMTKTTGLQLAKSDDFSKMILVKRKMILHHMYYKYEKALDKITK